MNARVNGLSIVALVLLVLGIFTIAADLDGSNNYSVAAVAESTPEVQTPATSQSVVPRANPVIAVQAAAIMDEPEFPRQQIDNEIRLPYDEYTLTQGPHGFSYGDAAIDLTAGKGAAIFSPINGLVVKNGMDEWGNTALVVENDRWQVKLLHGDYFPSEGEWVAIGQIIGAESNHGYTIDWQGRSCRNRNCGYHTHLNVLDRSTGANADLVDLFNP